MTLPAAVHVQSARRTVAVPAVDERGSRPLWSPNRPRLALAVESIGYLVPRTSFSGRVHSVFARACNLACDDTLLTVHAGSNGPATLRLACAAPADLRNLFDVGESVDCRDGYARTTRVELRLRHASVWRPATPGPRLPPARIAAHVHDALATLDRRRATQRNVLDNEAVASAAALREACRALDCEQAARHAGTLIGWGEGLTPAGDDFLVGLMAGLDALAGDERRRRLQAALAAAIASAAERTTPIAAHSLRLAARGHCNETLLCLRDALLCEADAVVIGAALHDALNIGATSGADTVSGLLAGLLAWLPPSCAAA
jgi:hypothetical protein|nr:DUF2877 domain-containing protein [Caldimonas sp.]